MEVFSMYVRKMLSFIIFFNLLSFALTFSDDLHLPDYPKHYNDYSKQCQVPVKCASDRRCPEVHNWEDLERWAQQEAHSRFEWESSFTDKQSYLISEDEYDYNLFATAALSKLDEVGVKNTMTTDILLENLAGRAKCTVRNLLEGRCPEVNQTLSLEKCRNQPMYNCDPAYPYRSYNGVCNNLQHATWGQIGNPLKIEIAPCYDDFVSKHRRSTTGQALPNNRKVISDLQQAFRRQSPDESEELFNIFGMMFSEFVTSDIIGRTMKRGRKATSGFRGCTANGSHVLSSRAPMAAPLSVDADDPNYGPMHIECLNYSPSENANDECHIKYPTKRNTATSYLDLSSMYGDGQYDKDGKLKTSHCGASSTFDHSSVMTTQFMAVAGLFAQLHNYCIDRVRSCELRHNVEIVIEKCRSLTIGVYQRIIYEEWLHALFGDDLFHQCNFDCEYDENLESSVSSTYANAPGRFQHLWIPDNFTLVKGGQRVQKPVFEFFNSITTFECPSVLEGMFDDPIRTESLSEALVNIFFSKDGVRGHCLLCLDLERCRDSGLCPLILYKHYYDKVSKSPTKCYNSFDDLSDIFFEDLIDVFKKHYESPFDIDALFLIFEKEIPEGAFMPKTVAAATCMQFKRLKCSDRFFFSWNEFQSPALKELINSINMMTLLAMFGGIDKVPYNPWFNKSGRLCADNIRRDMESKHHLFCSI
ncbi:chorion peroxidase-like [Armigeres subalbatus]|uniref:chorion peroxidase-like n=1 Tax=Armigeres subalbatus TaxID=124917 RepID=UPI002ED5C2B6